MGSTSGNFERMKMLKVKIIKFAGTVVGLFAAYMFKGFCYSVGVLLALMMFGVVVWRN